MSPWKVGLGILAGSVRVASLHSWCRDLRFRECKPGLSDFLWFCFTAMSFLEHPWRHASNVWNPMPNGSSLSSTLPPSTDVKFVLFECVFQTQDLLNLKHIILFSNPTQNNNGDTITIIIYTRCMSCFFWGLPVQQISQPPWGFPLQVDMWSMWRNMKSKDVCNYCAYWILVHSSKPMHKETRWNWTEIKLETFDPTNFSSKLRVFMIWPDLWRNWRRWLQKVV